MRSTIEVLGGMNRTMTNRRNIISPGIPSGDDQAMGLPGNDYDYDNDIDKHKKHYQSWDTSWGRPDYGAPR